MSGVDLPIKSAKYIVDFFEKNNGYEFFRVALNEVNKKLIFNNTNYYYLFNHFSRTLFGKMLTCLRIKQMFIEMQKLFKVSRCAKDKWSLYKGDNWMSITHDAVKCILEHEEYIRKRFKYTNCPDEIYKQTVLMNCGYGDKIFRPDNNKTNEAVRSIDWLRGSPYVWTYADKDELMNSGNLFARKFSTIRDNEIIDYLKDMV